MIELDRTAAAAELIGRLPRKREAIHIRMDGRFDGFDLIPAIVELARSAKPADLLIATLSYNRRGADRLLAMIDQGQIGRCTLVTSAMFQGKERATVDYLAAELERRDCELRIERNHCKLILIGTAEGRRIVVEGSQNLRTCNCYEQAVITDDSDLYQWHETYIQGRAKHGERT